MFLTQKLHFSLMKLGSIWVGASVLKSVDTGAVLIGNRHLKSHDAGVWCAITARRIEDPYSLKYC
jgi:hypothetical protein